MSATSTTDRLRGAAMNNAYPRIMSPMPPANNHRRGITRLSNGYSGVVVKAGDHGNHARDGETLRHAEHIGELVEQHAGGRHVRNGIQQVAQCGPQQLVVVGDGLERVKWAAMGVLFA